MANHRMVSNRVVNSAKFLQMPSESQLLFFHLVLRADDDGVVEAYPIMKLLSIAPDSFKLLAAKGLVRMLNEDQVVVITDWSEHNTIRADRKVDSIYKPLLQATYPELMLVEPRPRIDVKDNSRRVDGPRTAEVKLSKDNNSAEAPIEIVKDEPKPKAPRKDAAVLEVFRAFNPKYPKAWEMNRTQRKGAELLLEEHGIEQVKKAVALYSEYHDHQFMPNVGSPWNLANKWADLVNFKEKYA